MAAAPNHIIYADALAKARHYCAYQERCHYEVETKLREWGLHSDFVPVVCIKLSEEGYLDEERFARAYAQGKFKHNKWGRLKIIQGLQQKHIGKKLLARAVATIDEESYQRVLMELLTKKLRTTHARSPYELRQKLYNYAAQKGFESNLIVQTIDDLVTQA